MRTIVVVAALLGFAPALASAATQVRVATWNVQAVGDPGTLQYDAALAVLERIQADVVGINEVSSSADSAKFEQLALDAGYPFTVVPASNPFGAVRNAVMSRFPFAASPEIHTADSLSGDPAARDLSRLIIEVVLDVPENAQNLTLVIDHWKSGTGNDDEFRRALESYRITQSIGDLDSTVDAFVILGDINEEVDSVPRTPNPFDALPSGLPASFSLGADLQAILAGPGLENDPFFYLVDAAGLAAEPLFALQLDGSDATRPASGRRLDYIFVSSWLAVSAVGEVYDSADEGLPNGLPKFGSPPPVAASTDASDHFLVFADLSLPADVVLLPAVTGWGLPLLVVLLAVASWSALRGRARSRPRTVTAGPRGLPDGLRVRGSC